VSTILRTRTFMIFIIIASLLMPIFMAVPPVRADGPTYDINKIWASIYVNTDWTITVVYNITAHVAPGSPEELKGLYVPMPNFQYSNYKATDPDGNTLQIISGRSGNPEQGVLFQTPSTNPDELRTIYVSATVNGMIFPDDQNPGNVGMQFIPAWYPDCSSKINLRLMILAPPGVPIGDIKDMVRRDNNETIGDRNGAYWERTDWPVSDQFKTGISFPESYMTVQPITTEQPPPTPLPTGGGDWLWIFAIAAVIIIISAAAAFLLRGEEGESYSPPKLSIDSVKTGKDSDDSIRKDLDPIEAAVLLRIKPGMIVAMLLFSLARKKKLKVLQMKSPVKVVVSSAPAKLKYYERDLLQYAVKKTGLLDEEEVIKVLRALRRNVDKKIMYYDSLDTKNYYRDLVTKTWKKVELVTPAMRFKQYDDNLLWLMIDKDFAPETKRVLGTEPTGMTQDNYTFYTTYYPIFIYSSHPPPPPPTVVPPPPIVPPTTTPTTTTTPTPTTTQPPSPPVVTSVEGFANNFCTSVETMSTALIVNVEKAMGVITSKAETTTESHTTNSGSGDSSCHCHCACVDCACACACVGCACACAGGGGICFKLKGGMKSLAIAISVRTGWKMESYPNTMLLPMKQRPEYGFYLYAPSGRLHLWSTINTNNYFMDLKELSESDQNLVMSEIQKLGE